MEKVTPRKSFFYISYLSANLKKKSVLKQKIQKFMYTKIHLRCKRKVNDNYYPTKSLVN